MVTRVPRAESPATPELQFVFVDRVTRRRPTLGKSWVSGRSCVTSDAACDFTRQSLAMYCDVHLSHNLCLLMCLPPQVSPAHPGVE